MIQRTYHFTCFAELEGIAKKIHEDKNYQEASGVLVQIYNPRPDIEEALLVRTLNQYFPHACISGMTSIDIAEKDEVISELPLEISFIFFQNTKLTQFEFDLSDSTSFESGRSLNEKLESFSNLKCLLICYAAKSSSINTFIHEFHHCNIPIFGAKAGYNISKKNLAHVYGSKVYSQGIVVVAFSGESLSVYMDCNLGWQPIGIDMVVTKVDGNSIVEEIDNEPAVNIYSKYLRVDPNQYFLKNVCEFPLVFNRKNFSVARVPISYDEKGGLVFSSDIHLNDKFRLSYASKENIYAVSRQSALELSAFHPDAVFLFACGNIMQFLQENFETEVGIYKKYVKDLSVATVSAELFITHDGNGCDLNSTLVVIGLKENGDYQNTVITNHGPDSVSSEFCTLGEIPFIERILTFLERTSQELNVRNLELKKIAFTDQLTKIYNRRQLEGALENVLTYSQEGRSYGILFIDIDHFKNINDTYGHDIGDMVLVEVVNQIRSLMEDDHIFGRWGGEEFIYLVPDVDEKSLGNFGEKVRKIIENKKFSTVNHITVSVGVTLVNSEEAPASLLKRADQAVYEAKELGRNKVVLY